MAISSPRQRDKNYTEQNHRLGLSLDKRPCLSPYSLEDDTDFYALAEKRNKGTGGGISNQIFLPTAKYDFIFVTGRGTQIVTAS